MKPGDRKIQIEKETRDQCGFLIVALIDGRRYAGTGQDRDRAIEDLCFEYNNANGIPNA